MSSTIRSHGRVLTHSRPHGSRIHTPEPAFVTDTVSDLHSEARRSTQLRGEPDWTHEHLSPRWFCRRRGIRYERGLAAGKTNGSFHAVPVRNIPQHRTRSFRANATMAFFFETPFSCNRTHVAKAQAL